MTWNNKYLKLKLGTKPISKLQEILECSYPTAWRKYTYGLFTLAETIVIANELRITKDEYFIIFVGGNLNDTREKVRN